MYIQDSCCDTSCIDIGPGDVAFLRSSKDFSITRGLLAQATEVTV